ncbi:uncharacterized protein LOC112527118 isoform X1 [Cynara cardunculus var. scolymus]|nr:uncharacterized protein LOC112527118 isoform X1 [Cynara cardunculus var. scolymus]
MVLGLRSKHRKDGSVQVNYLVHVQEIKPWSPSQSPESSLSMSLQWETGDQLSGYLSPIVVDSKIEFNKSFVLPLTLRREKRDRDKFQKYNLEFHLYEPRKDKPNKDQLLGSAIVNLGDFGIIDNVLSVSVPITSKKSSKSVAQPVLFLNIQSNDKDETNSSSRSSLSKQSSLEKNGQESASEVTNEENDGELEIASFTDDEDDYTNSSYKNNKDVVESRKQGNEQLPALPLGVGPPNNHNTSSKLPERSNTSVRKEPAAPFLQSSFSTMGSHDKTVDPKTRSRILEPGNRCHGVQEDVVNTSGRTKEGNPQPVITNSVSKAARGVESSHEQSANSETAKEDMKQEGSEQDDRTPEEKRQFSEDNLVGKFLASRKQDKLRSNTLVSSRKPAGGQGNIVSTNKLKHLKSVQLPKAGGFSGSGLPTPSPNRADKDKAIRTNDSVETGVPKSESSNRKTEDMSRIEMLEEELRETAAIEAGLYSIVAEHGSSTNKVHAPARRLSRFYLHACKENYQERRVNAARAIISGLVLVSKSCGNDVPRLTFWLSNSVMLRAIVFQTVGEPPILDANSTKKHKNGSKKVSDDWQDPQTFIIALEKVEGWIFSRIIESVWWQTLTPHMQSTATNASGKMMGLTSKKTSGSKNGLGNHQGNFSIELWKKAFKDASERLCPTRAEGHECGCLPVLPRLVMEQLVGRLDVAMFNAILRESAEEMPTDPLSDPIADLRVLPIPAGRSSFGAGAQLKNTIGTWSRWLTDLFGIEDNDSHEDTDDLVDDKKAEKAEFDTSFKAFRLLHALSDLMMLPFEMLADKSTRKEVCPTFSTPLIRRVVCSFVPDEFSPNPIPNELIEALDTEMQDNEIEASEGSLINFPCIAPPSAYKPPPSHSLSTVIGIVGTQSLRRSSSSVLKKSYTSDDELDELDSPLTSIIRDTSKGEQWFPKGGRSIMRYQLLREVWKDGE